MNQVHGSMIGKDQQMLCKLTKVAQALGQESELRVKESVTIPEFLPCGSAQHSWRVPEPHKAALTAASWTFLRNTLGVQSCWSTICVGFPLPKALTQEMEQAPGRLHMLHGTGCL